MPEPAMNRETNEPDRSNHSWSHAGHSTTPAIAGSRGDLGQYGEVTGLKPHGFLSVREKPTAACQCAIIKTGFDHRFYHREIWGNVEVVRSEKRMISNVKNFRPGVFTLKFGEVI